MMLLTTMTRRSFFTGIALTSFFGFELPSIFGTGEAVGEVVERLAYEPGHTEWDSGIVDKEIYRTRLGTNQVLEVDRVELRLRGGGSKTNLSIDVYDASTGNELNYTDAGSMSLGGSQSSENADIVVRLTNETGSPQVATPIVRGRILDVEE